MIKIYSLGDCCYDDRVLAIRCKDVKNIEEARNIILSIRRKWQEEYTDEEYRQKFGRDKVLILGEETCHIRKIGRWECSGYEYKEWNWVSRWKKTEKLGRGAMKVYLFYCADDWTEYNIYFTEK